MARASATAQQSTVPSWTHIPNECSPSLAFHASCHIPSGWFLHGGITSSGSTAPVNGAYFLDNSSRSFKSITAILSPNLSHHCAINLDDQHILLIGGWNGRSRGSDLHLFDVAQQRWTQPVASGFPAGAGLSSHTASLLKNGEVLVLGREGSLRMQRRSGSAYALVPAARDFSRFVYRPEALHVDSRSGHSASAVGSTLYVMGGREDRLVQLFADCASPLAPSALVDRLAGALRSGARPAPKPPGGRKNHAAVPGRDALLVVGGETFDGRSRGPVPDTFLLDVRNELAAYRVPVGGAVVARAGAACLYDEQCILLHGGVNEANRVTGDIAEFTVSG